MTRPRAALGLGLAAALLAWPGSADVILSAEALNGALKKTQRLLQQLGEGAGRGARAESLFQLGVEADALATLFNDEVAAHGMQEKALLDLGLGRARELGVVIAWNAEKQKFFYDGAAFRRYADEAPRGPRIAEASFRLVESEFFQSRAEDAAGLLAASEHKQAFLRRFPRFAAAADVGVLLAIDYRDLYRHYQAAGDAEARDRFRERARAQFKVVVQRFRGSEQARIAGEMLRRFEAELRARDGGG